MQYWLILTKICCHGNSFCSLENSDSTFEFADRENPTIHAKNVSISCIELKSVQFWRKFGCHGNSLCFLENSDSTFEFVDPENPTIHAKNVSISCIELKSVQFWRKFGCYGNSLCSLENSDSVFVSADPENPTIHARTVSISFTEMKLCLFEYLACLFTIAIFTIFAKKDEIVLKNFIKPQIGTRIRGNTPFELLTTFLRPTMRSGQVSKNVKK